MQRLMCIIFAILACTGGTSANWQNSQIHDPIEVAFNSHSAVVDAQGLLHVVFGGNHLYHAYGDGRDWAVEVVDSAPRVGRHARLAIGPHGRLHILYRADYEEWATSPFSNHGQLLKYAVGTTGSWETENLPFQSSDTYTANLGPIDVDSSGTPHIAYMTNDGVTHAVRMHDGWTSAVAIDSGGVITTGGDKSTQIHLAVDLQDNVHLTYKSTHAWLVEGIWQTESYLDASDSALLSEPLGEYMVDVRDHAFAIDASGRHAVCYSSYSDVSGKILRCARREKGTWSGEVVDTQQDIVMPRGAGLQDLVYRIAATVDANGALHVASYVLLSNSRVSQLRYSTDANGSWVNQTLEIEDPSPDSYVSILIDPSGIAHFFLNAKDSSSSTRNEKTALTHISWDGSSWHQNTIVGASALDIPTGRFTNLAVDGAGASHIVYLVENPSAVPGYWVYYATNASGDWVHEKISDKGADGVGPIVQLDSEGDPHIVFSGEQEFDSLGGIYYAKKKNATWFLERLNTASSGVWQTRVYGLDFELNGNAANIAYVGPESDWKLQFISNADGSWTERTVHDFGYSKFSTYSVVIDVTTLPSGDVGIAFSSSHEQQLMLATLSGTGSMVEQLLSPPARFYWLDERAINLTNTGAVYFAVEAANCAVPGVNCFFGILLHSNTSDNWVTRPIDNEWYLAGSDIYRARYPALAVRNSSVRVAYYHEAYRQLRVAYDTRCGINMVEADPADIALNELSTRDAKLDASIALTPNLETRVSYHDLPNGSLKHAASSEPSTVQICTNISEFSHHSTQAAVSGQLAFGNGGDHEITVQGFMFGPLMNFTFQEDACTNTTLQTGASCEVSLNLAQSGSFKAAPVGFVYVDNQIGESSAVFATVSNSQIVRTGGLSDGDVAPLGNRDGVVTIADALVTLRYALGLVNTMSSDDVQHGDVAPLNEFGIPRPDGAVTIADALVVLRKALRVIEF